MNIKKSCANVWDKYIAGYDRDHRSSFVLLTLYRHNDLEANNYTLGFDDF
jgi:hypothetical protein